MTTFAQARIRRADTLAVAVYQSQSLDTSAPEGEGDPAEAPRPPVTTSPALLTWGEPA